MQQRGCMYEGVDTVILNNELAYEDLLPVAFKPLPRALDAAAASARSPIATCACCRCARPSRSRATVEQQGRGLAAVRRTSCASKSR